MSKKHVVEKYIDGFRSGNPAKVVSCLSPEVIWRVHGCQTLRGRDAFAADITNEEFSNCAKLEVHQMIEEGNRIAVVGSGIVLVKPDTQRAFNFSEVFEIEGELIREVDTFHIWT